MFLYKSAHIFHTVFWFRRNENIMFWSFAINLIFFPLFSIYKILYENECEKNGFLEMKAKKRLKT